MNLQEIINQIAGARENLTREEITFEEGDQAGVNEGIKRVFQAFWEAVQGETDWTNILSVGFYLVTKGTSNGEGGFNVHRSATGRPSAEMMALVEIMKDNGFNSIPREILELIFVLAQRSLQDTEGIE